jgi:hypothetical protein
MATKHLYAEQFRPDRDIDNILKELEVTINYIEWTTCIYINYMCATLGQHLNKPTTRPVFILKCFNSFIILIHHILFPVNDCVLFHYIIFYLCCGLILLSDLLVQLS